MHNRSLARWRAKERSLGAWISLTDLHAIEMIARMGFDWLCFDLQHGLLTEGDLPAAIAVTAASEATPLARVVANDAAAIGRVLDAGAYGVIVPMINDPDEAAAAVAACRYPPYGRRSCGPMRGVMIEGPRYLASADSEVACIAMIETAEGLENAEAIAGTPGIDALFIGPVDLCYGIGVAPGNFADPRFVAAIAAIRSAGFSRDCPVGMFGYSADLARRALDEGFAFASAGTDVGFLREGATAALAIAADVADEDTATTSPRY